MSLFVRSANPIWFLVDLVGQPLNDEYWAIFLSNTFPYIPQSPTHDPEGLIPWSGGKVQFQPGGTLPNELYFDPDLVYRIEIRRGQTQSDPLIYEINNYVPENGSTNNNNDLLGGDNQITNPQFENINFESPYTYTQGLSGSYVVQFAPGWELVLEGQGTTVFTQLELNGTDDIQGSPPYAIRINNNGWDSALIRQRFSQNGAIFASGAISMSATVRGSVTVQQLTFSYNPSSPGTPVEILTATNVPVGSFTVLKGAVNLPASSNTSTGDAAYVDMVIQLEGTGIMDITNVQVLGQSLPLPVDFVASTDIPLFIEQTIERETDLTFHYWKDQLIQKPIPSWLIGWDFPLNPAQTGDTVAAAAIGANKSQYVWDNTIVFQSVDSGVGVSRGSNGELLLTAALTTQMGVIQYIEQKKAREILNNAIAMNISANCGSGTVPVTVSLWYTTDVSLPVISSPTYNSIVGTLDPNGKPATFNGNWTEVPRINGISSILTLVPQLSNNFTDNMLSGWNLEGIADVTTATYMAIVIGTASVTAANTISINSISLCSGDIATRPAPQSPDEVLRECQYFYEQSYAPGTAPATATDVGMKFAIFPFSTDGSSTDLYINTFQVDYKQTKRIDPSVKFYTPAGTPDKVKIVTYKGDGTIPAPNSGSNPIEEPIGGVAPPPVWTAVGASVDGVIMRPSVITNSMGFLTTEDDRHGELNYHYVADARLGVI